MLKRGGGVREGERCTSVAEGDFQIEEFVYVCVCVKERKRERERVRDMPV